MDCAATNGAATTARKAIFEYCMVMRLMGMINWQEGTMKAFVLDNDGIKRWD
jgi:hypothetical protein